MNIYTILYLRFKIFLIEILTTISYVCFSFITLLVPVLLIVAYLTLVERKIIGSSQRRLGPNTTEFSD